MIRTLSKFEEARQKAAEALQDAYGRTQPTPDGLHCRIGRIGRAYDLMARANGNAGKYQDAIGQMEKETLVVFNMADRLVASFVRLAKLEGQEGNIETPICDCPHCANEPRKAGMNKDEWERFVAAFDAAHPVG